MELNDPEPLLPDALRELWKQGDVCADELWKEQQRRIGEYKMIWAEALELDGHIDLQKSLMAEIGRYTGCADLGRIEQACRGAVAALKEEWKVSALDATNAVGIEAFYDRSEMYLYDLMWWHTLIDDDDPLAYVVAMKFARRHGCSRYLDFGAGVGAGGILFARHGFDVALADISGTLLSFSDWRMRQRRLNVRLIDLKTERLPSAQFDFVTALDVWEHLVDPVSAVDQVANAIAPGGYLFGRFAADPDPERPQHIVLDFVPTLERLADHGFELVWQDEWLWGHKAFRKI